MVRNKGSKARSPSTVLLLLPLLLLPPTLSGCSSEEEAQAELAALQADYMASEESHAEKMVSFAPRYRALVREYWGTEAALEAGIWLMQTAARQAGPGDRGDVVEAFTDSILAEYADSPGLDKLAKSASLYTDEQLRRYFGELRESSPHPGVRAAAIFYPARLEIRTLRPRHGLPPLLRRGQNADSDDPEALEAVEADLRLVLEEYGDLPAGHTTYGVLADAVLNPHTAEELALGQPAPEIVGTTVEGEEMRLSDFKGKVTVISFWGDW